MGRLQNLVDKIRGEDGTLLLGPEDSSPESPTVDFPITFSADFKSVRGGYKVKCDRHGYQKLKRTEINSRLRTPIGRKSIWYVVSQSYKWMNQRNSLLQRYKKGKVDFASYISEISSLDYIQQTEELMTEASTSVELSCGCLVGIQLGKAESGEREPKLVDALLNLGLKSKDDLRLINAAFYQRPENQATFDDCNKKADDIISSLEAMNVEIEQVKSVRSTIHEMFGEFSLDYSGLDSKLLNSVDLLVEQAVTDLELAKIAVVISLTDFLYTRRRIANPYKLQIELKEQLSTPESAQSDAGKIRLKNARIAELEAENSSLMKFIERMEREVPKK